MKVEHTADIILIAATTTDVLEILINEVADTQRIKVFSVTLYFLFNEANNL